MGNNLISLYLYGSVAEGRAKIGHSDIDFVVVLNQNDDISKIKLDEISQKITKEMAELIPKMDLPSVDLNKVKKDRWGWQAYLKILGLNIFGPDIVKNYKPVKIDKRLTNAWNGDLLKFIDEHQQKISTANSYQKKIVIKTICTKIIRTLFMHAAVRQNLWTTNFNDQYSIAQKGFPEWVHTLKQLKQGHDQKLDSQTLTKLLNDNKYRLETIVNNGLK